MVLKFFYYFVTPFVIISLFLLYQDPYKLKIIKNNKNEPNIEMNIVTNYAITKNGVSHIVKALKVLRFADRDEFYGINSMMRDEDNFLEELRANSGVLIKDNLKLIGNIRYKNSDNMSFISEKLDYNLSTKMIKTDTNFILKNANIVVNGTSLVYNIKKRRVYADNIKSTIQE